MVTKELLSLPAAAREQLVGLVSGTVGSTVGVVTPETAIYFRDIRGVYKNCRGIWAAQWTDEAGRRHTKYFNPKYFVEEEHARVSAFLFKMQVQQEVDEKGGPSAFRRAKRKTLKA